MLRRALLLELIIPGEVTYHTLGAHVGLEGGFALASFQPLSRAAEVDAANPA